MSEHDLRLGTYVSEFDLLRNQDNSLSVRKISRKVLGSIDEPRLRLLRALSNDTPQHLLAPEAVNAEPGQRLNEFYAYHASGTLEDAQQRMHELIVEGKMSEADILIMLLQLTRATAYIHQLNLVHGDIRPSNILIAGTAHEPKVTLFDYSSTSSPHVQTELLPSWNEEHPADPYVDFRFDVFSIGQIFQKMTHEPTGELKPGLDPAHPIFETISAALGSFEERPENAAVLYLMLEKIWMILDAKHSEIRSPKQ